MGNTIAEPNNKYFNPLAPRGARQTSNYGHARYDYFNPLAPRGARLIRF